ncbi:MAG: hypothetical protein KDC73_11105 [Ignavibacteriae bacterium]|nr:hypothetical protein [Ignavibacteriota bacterium]MCB0725238.1 hypothetical protein [Ignavibacteriota bacterium]MCB9242438.1 hypothetical protein [Ignavibacteriales bacterium]
MKNIIIGLFVMLILYSCGKDSESESTGKDSSKNEYTEPGPSDYEIESGVYELISKIPYKNYQYNTAIFMEKDGVYKNLAITNMDILSKDGVSSSTKGDGREQRMQIRLSGVTDVYDVAGGLPPRLRFVGRTNFIVEKEFRFVKNGNSWMGFLYDRLRNKSTLRLEDDYIRFR